MNRFVIRLLTLFTLVLLTGALSVFAQDTPVKGTSYTVQKGDTVLSVAIHFGKPAACIGTANKLSGLLSIPDTVKTLVIPDDCTTVTGQGGGGSATLTDQSYTVQRGDQLNKIADAMGATVACIAQSNHIANPNLIYVGQELTITASCQGGGGGGAATASSTSSGGTCQFDRNPRRTTSDGKYTVQSGDTLDFIACDFGIALDCLKTANPELSADNKRLAVGETLTIDLSCPAWTPWPGAGELPNS